MLFVCFLSPLSNVSPLTNLFHSIHQCLITPPPPSSGWLLPKFRYWLVWVSFLITLMLMEPSVSTIVHMSRNANSLSTLTDTSSPSTISLTSVSVMTSPSVVQFMSSSTEFKWTVNSCDCVFHNMWVSPTFRHWVNVVL